jgi:hypothetical protein
MLSELAEKRGRLTAFEARYIKGYAMDYLEGLGLPAWASDDGAAIITLYSPTGKRADWQRALTIAGLSYGYGRRCYFVNFGHKRNLRALVAATVGR